MVVGWVFLGVALPGCNRGSHEGFVWGSQLPKNVTNSGGHEPELRETAPRVFHPYASPQGKRS